MNDQATLQKAIDLAQKKGLFRKGEGADVIVRWSPELSLKLNAQGKPTGMEYMNTSEAHLQLAQELIHAVRFMKGTSSVQIEKSGQATRKNRKELKRAVGLGIPGSLKAVSTNNIRQQLGYPKQTGIALIADETPRAPDSPMTFARPTTPPSEDDDVSKLDEALTDLLNE